MYDYDCTVTTKEAANTHWYVLVELDTVENSLLVWGKSEQDALAKMQKLLIYALDEINERLSKWNSAQAATENP